MHRFIFSLCTVFILFGCSVRESVKDNRIISVSILPQKYFVERIAGDLFEVNVMVPPGASPATYEPLPRQLEDLEQTLAYFRIGPIGFEKVWMPRIQSINPNMPVFNLAEGVELIDSGKQVHADHNHERGTDPHIWLSPKEVRTIARNLYEALVQLDTSREELFYKNYLEFMEEIDELHTEIRRKLEPYKGRSFLIFHPSLTYLARDYNLQQLPIEWEGKDPSPGHLKELIDRSRKENLRNVFVQEQFDMNNARAVADELDGRVIRINPLEEDWKKSLILITDSLVGMYRENEKIQF